MPSSTQQNVWVVIPVYNNAESIRTVLAGCLNHVARVLVVDDGSTDVDVREYLSDLEVVVLRHSVNRGKGAALRTAMNYVHQADGGWMITLDGDGKHSPDDIPAVLEALDEETVIIGKRKNVQGDKPKSGGFRRRFSDCCVFLETGWQLQDTQSGFRAYPVSYITKLPLKCKGYDFEREILARAAWAGLKFKMVAVCGPDSTIKQGKSSFRPFMDNLRIFLTHARLFGHRMLPWPDKRLVARELSLKDLFRHPSLFSKRLLEENASPWGLAASAWIGVFLGTVPLIGFHTLSILYVCLRLRLNKVMAVVIQNVCMPPVVPGICIACGYFMIHGKFITRLSLAELGSAPLARLWEWALGSLVVAPLLATFIGVIIYLAALRIRARRGIGKGCAGYAEVN